MRVVSDNSIEFDREAAFAIQVLEGNSYLMGIASNNTSSLKNAITNVAAIGISLNPASKLAYLVPRDGKVCLDISYMGMMHLAQQCGAIQWGQSIIVREKDNFELRGITQEPAHKYNPFDKERGGAVGVYVVVKTDGGDFLTHTMSIEEVFAIRDRSSAWKAFKQKGTKCPWVTDEGEMVKKTCVKQAAKYWPRRDRLDQAVHHMNTDGGEGFEQEKDITPIAEDQVTAITDLLSGMNKTWPELFTALSALFKRTIAATEELSQEEAAKAIAFMKLRSEKKQ